MTFEKIRTNVYLDKNFKDQAKEFFKSYGLSLSDGLNLLLKKTLDKKAFKEFRKNPYPTNPKLHSKKLKASNNFRLRIGKFRFKYFIEDNILVVTIEEADSREDIYK